MTLDPQTVVTSAAAAATAALLASGAIWSLARSAWKRLFGAAFLQAGAGVLALVYAAPYAAAILLSAGAMAMVGAALIVRSHEGAPAPDAGAAARPR